MALLREMPSKWLEPNVISYSAAISSCEKSQLWEMALALLREMPSKELEPDVISYSAAISSCEKSALWEKALALLREMPSQWLEPDVVSYSAAISSCEKSGACNKHYQWKDALILLEEMIEASENQWQPGSGIHNVVRVASSFANIEAWDEYLDCRIYDCLRRAVLVLHRIVV